MAKDLNSKYIDELDYGIDDSQRFLTTMRNTLGPFVIQAPAQSHMLSVFYDQLDVIVVFMYRDLEDIYKSEERINWGSNELELRKYRGLIHYSYSFPPEVDTTKAASVKYYFWENIQEPQFKGRGFSLEYESMKKHPMWLPWQRHCRHPA